MTIVITRRQGGPGVFFGLKINPALDWRVNKFA